MKNYEERAVNLNRYFDLPNPGLKAYFSNQEAGNDDEYRTPFYRDKSVKAVLDGWHPTLEAGLSDTWPTLLQFENDLAEKVGPMSIQKPLKDRIPDIEHYYDDVLLSSEPLDNDALDSVVKEWSSLAGLHLRNQTSTYENMKKSTSSGSPFFVSNKRDVADKTIPCYGYYASWNTPVQVLEPSGVWNSCAILGWRGQEGGETKEDVKQRVIWMFPFANALMDLQCYQPLIEKAQEYDLVPAWVSNDDVDVHITKLFDTKSEDDLIICTDFSKFDQHFNQDCQDAAKSILRRLFTGKDFDRWLHDVFPVKYNIPLMYKYGHIMTGPHGMASGSGGTNADETLLHRALQYECALSHNQKLNPHSMCLGDDGILTYPGISVEDVVSSYTRHGQEMNLDKQYADKHECIFLRKWHHTNYRIDGICRGVYATTRALGHLCEQERFYDPDVWSKEMVCLRYLSIINNVEWHPLRDQFAEYCIKGDKFKLGLEIPGFLDNIAQLATEATDLMPDFLGYVKSIEKSDRPDRGIADWWIVKYLKSKA